jgi:hypothetical protein
MLLASAERHFFKQRRRNSRWVDQRSAPVQPQHAVAEVGHSARAQALKIAMFAAILQGGVARASSMLATLAHARRLVNVARVSFFFLAARAVDGCSIGIPRTSGTFRDIISPLRAAKTFAGAFPACNIRFAIPS